jgi:hypothetical protein
MLLFDKWLKEKIRAGIIFRCGNRRLSGDQITNLCSPNLIQASRICAIFLRLFSVLLKTHSKDKALRRKR